MKYKFVFLILVLISLVGCQPIEPTTNGNSYVNLDPQSIIDEAVYVTREDGLECLVYTGIVGGGNSSMGFVAMSCDWDNWER